MCELVATDLSAPGSHEAFEAEVVPMARKKPSRSALDRERARRREQDLAKLEVRDVATAELGVAPALSQAVNEVSNKEPAPPAPPLAPPATGDGARRPGQRICCVWCGSSVQVKARGPLPKYCSANCGHRGWEQERAARAGRAAVVVLDRTVTAYPQGTSEWIAQLERLATEVGRAQLDGTSLTAALDLVHAAVVSRQRLGYPNDPW